MSNCKMLVLASVAAGLSVTAADAADLIPPPPIMAPVVRDFSGWYLRGNIGFSNQQVELAEAGAAAAAVCHRYHHARSS